MTKLLGQPTVTDRQADRPTAYLLIANATHNYVALPKTGPD